MVACGGSFTILDFKLNVAFSVLINFQIVFFKLLNNIIKILRIRDADLRFLKKQLYRVELILHHPIL